MWRRSTDVVRVVPFLAMAGQSMTERKRPGRPPLDEEPAKNVIRVRVTPAQRLKLRRVAYQNDTDMSGVIREAVDEYCADCQDTPVFRRPTKRSRP